MREELIIRIWRIAYIKLFDMENSLWSFKDKQGEWEADKIFWRFYWLTPKYKSD